MKTLSFGEILFDRIEGEHFFGGAPANVAVHLSRFGADSYILSALGDDVPGDEARELLKAEGVRLNYVSRTAAAPTGIIEVQVIEGVRCYDIREGAAWDAISPESLTELLQENWDLIYCGTLAQRSENNRALLMQILEEGTYKQLFFDVNMRQNYYSASIIRDTLEHSTILKLNDEELPLVSRMIFGEVLKEKDFSARISAEYPVELLILTMGSRGARLYHKSTNKPFSVPCGDVNVIDTVGAGDSFSGTFLSCFLKGESLEEAARKAALVADYVVSRTGATPRLSPELEAELVG